MSSDGQFRPHPILWNWDTMPNTGKYWDLLIGCVLAVAGNLLISISLNLQKFSHMRNEVRSEELKRHYTRNPLWWLGLVLMVVGEIGNFSAYGFAPASLVAPLGTTTVIANMFLAAIFLKEKIRPEDLFGSAVAIVGAFLIVVFSSKKEDVYDANELVTALTQVAFIVYVVIELLALVVLFVLLYRLKVENVLVYLLITSLLASFTVISAKALSSMLQHTFSGQNQLTSWIFWFMVAVLAFTAILQIKYLNMAMKSFYSTIVVPINFVFFTISAIVAGIVYYREFYGLSALDIFMFISGCTLCFTGVHFISAGRAVATPGDSVDASRPQPPPPRGYVANLIPTWLLTNVNQAHVQPTSTLVHTDGDRPIMTQREHYLPVGQDSDQDPLVHVDSSPEDSYGATNRTG